ncbi:hypothetical protein LXL04_035442 [Taraxacum kok-saghyz]
MLYPRGLQVDLNEDANGQNPGPNEMEIPDLAGNEEHPARKDAVEREQGEPSIKNQIVKYDPNPAVYEIKIPTPPADKENDETTEEPQTPPADKPTTEEIPPADEGKNPTTENLNKELKPDSKTDPGDAKYGCKRAEHEPDQARLELILRLNPKDLAHQLPQSVDTNDEICVSVSHIGTNTVYMWLYMLEYPLFPEGLFWRDNLGGSTYINIVSELAFRTRSTTHPCLYSSSHRL